MLAFSNCIDACTVPSICNLFQICAYHAADSHMDCQDLCGANAGKRFPRSLAYSRFTRLHGFQ